MKTASPGLATGCNEDETFAAYNARAEWILFDQMQHIVFLQYKTTKG